MDYQAAVNYVLSFADYEKIPGSSYFFGSFDLRRMDQLLGYLHNPHLSSKTVHVAGTKGKGSTSAMIASVLIASGFRTGLYTSPHLNTIRERIKLNDRLITTEEFAFFIERLQPDIEKTNSRNDYGQLTTYEILTALAFTYFSYHDVEFQVMEVGVGGRLDATNVVQPAVCVITSISYDHTDALGNTLGKIAAEKAGIIKPGCTVISAPQAIEAEKIITETCRQKEAKLIQVGNDVKWHKTTANLERQSFMITGKKKNYDLSIPLLGDHQLENAATAVAALEVLADSGVSISDENIVNGLSNVSWPGRLQILRHNPVIVVDGAHNTYSLRRLREAIVEYFNFETLFLIVGISCDKSIADMVHELSYFDGTIIATSSTHPRASDPSEIALHFTKLGINIQITQNITEAISYSMNIAKEKDLICITGSLFLVAEAIAHVNGKVIE